MDNMRYAKINPELTPEIINNAGFKFDGYYYNHKFIDLRLNKVDNGYRVTSSKTSQQLSKLTIVTYSDLIRVLVQALPIYLSKLMSAKYSSTEQMEKVISEKLDEFWGFDKDLSFTIESGANRLRCIPNNEYSASLSSGGIVPFSVTYREIDSEIDSEITIEANPATIGFIYLFEIIKSITNKDFIIKSVNIIDPSGISTPFFGMGMR